MGDVDTRLVESALDSIPSDDRDDWITVGMALKSEGLDESIWHRWSERSEKYDEADARKVWRSFPAGGKIKLGSLFNLAKDKGWRFPESAKKRTAQSPKREPPPPPEPEEVVLDSQPPDLDPKLIAWFAGRGISETVVRGAGARLVKHWMPQTKREEWTICVPYVWRGQTVNAKYRTVDKHFAMETGKARPLYNVDALDPAVSYVVEGELDALAMIEAGFDAVVSVPNGAQSIDSLVLCETEVKSVERWVLAVDGDAPGIKLEADLSRRLGRERCMRVTWPKGCKDANETLLAHGKDGLRDTVLNAMWYPVDGILVTEEVDVDSMRWYDAGFSPGMTSGWASVDELYTVQPGELTVITGIPGHGKSTWLDNLMCKLAARHGWKFGVFSPENAPAGRHKAMLVEKWSGAPMRGGPKTAGMLREEFEAWLNTIGPHFDWIEPAETQSCTVDSILESARALVFRHGINGLVLDPWNEIELDLDTRNETTAINDALRKIRRFARAHDCHVWIVAHPAKLYRQDGVYPVPTLYDISGSAHFRNRADNGIVVWRDFESDDRPVQIHVQKVRFRHNGRIGMAELRHDPICATYHDLAPADNDSGWTDHGEGYA